MKISIMFALLTLFTTLSGTCHGALNRVQPEKPLYLVAVQMKVDLDMYRSAGAFGSRIDGILAEVSKKVPPGADVFVTFPEYTGTFLVLADAPKTVYKAKDLSQAMERLVKANLWKTFWIKLTKRVSWARALSLVKAQKINEMYTSTFSRLALKYSYWICSGSVIAPEFNKKGKVVSSDVYNTAYTFAPDGAKIATQRKIHLVEMENKDNIDLSFGNINDMTIADVAGRKVAIAICLDTFYTDVKDQLTNMKGAPDIFVQPTANGGAWDAWQQGDWLRGIHMAIVRDRRAAVGVNAMMVGDILGLNFEGQSSIIVRDAPTLTGYSLTGPLSGFVKVAASPLEEEVLIWKMD